MRKAVCNAIHIRSSNTKGMIKNPDSSGIMRNTLLKKEKAYYAARMECAIK